MTDFYAVLGVSPDATPEDIKRAYRKLARKNHPDLATGADAEATFKAINEAHDILKDPQARAEYDAARAQSNRPGRDWQGDYSFQTDQARSDDDLRSAFSSMFGGSAFGAGSGFGDLHARIQLAIEDAYRGTHYALSVPVRSLSPDGKVRLHHQDLSVRIPPGVMEGQTLRVGGASAGDGAMDLLVEVAFAPHPVYRAEGRDVFMDLPVAPWEAALGGKVVLPTPDGKVDLKIPANARSGQKLRLKGRGIPGQPPGDLFATLQIINPRVSDAEARALFEQMARDLPFDPRENLGRTHR